MLILRPVEASDLDALVSLADQLDSMNLPADRDFLAERISRSEHSFAGTLEDWREGVYVFVLVDTDAGRCIGTSTIIAKLGRHAQAGLHLERAAQYEAQATSARALLRQLSR